MNMFSTRLFTFAATSLFAATASAVDWESARRNPAEITVLNCQAVPLTVGEGKGQYLKVPAKLDGATIFVESEGKKVGNTADFTVVKEGWIFVIANYGYEGNSSGDWDDKRWTEAQFKKNGWEELSSKQMGGPLVNKGNNEPKVFAKRVRPKDSMRLVVNKYGAPHIVVFPAPSTAPKKP